MALYDQEPTDVPMALYDQEPTKPPMALYDQEPTDVPMEMNGNAHVTGGMYVFIAQTFLLN